MGFIADAAGIHGNLLEQANHRIILLIVVEQGLVGVLPQGDKLLESPKGQLLQDLDIGIHCLDRGIKGVKLALYAGQMGIDRVQLDR